MILYIDLSKIKPKHSILGFSISSWSINDDYLKDQFI
jgi:hypothetical protein